MWLIFFVPITLSLITWKFQKYSYVIHCLDLRFTTSLIFWHFEFFFFFVWYFISVISLLTWPCIASRELAWQHQQVWRIHLIKLTLHVIKQCSSDRCGRHNRTKLGPIFCVLLLKIFWGINFHNFFSFLLVKLLSIK